MEPARVMILGNGHAHLQARAAVLQHFWAVQTVALDDGAEPTFDVELVVVCHSLPDAERQHWVEKLRQLSPAMLLVRMNGYDGGPHQCADATVDEAHGPGALVSTIYELLTERGLSSRIWPEETDSRWVQ